MNKRTVIALKGSIKKWEKIVAGTGSDMSIDNCPLCKIFYWGDCEGCPVSMKTGESDCMGSPYKKWSDTVRGMGPFKANTPELKKIAKAELRFLKGLLP